MNIWNKIFANSDEHKKDLLEVANNCAIGDGTPILLEKNPNLELLFTDPNPSVPQRITNRNRKYWAGLEVDARRVYLIMAYLYHPNPNVIIDVLQNHIHKSKGWYIQLAYLLIHPNSKVRHEAAKAIWKTDESFLDTFIQVVFTVLSSTGIVPSGIPPSEALKAARILQEYCPPEHRQLFEERACEKKFFDRELFPEHENLKNLENHHLLLSHSPRFSDHSPEHEGYDSDQVISIQERAKIERAAEIVQDNNLESLLESEYGIQVTPSKNAHEQSWFREFIQHYHNGNTSQALSVLDEAFKNDPQEGLIWFWYGYIQDDIYHDPKKALQYYLTGAKICDKGKTYLLEKAAEQLLLECHDVANSIKFFFQAIRSMQAHADEKSDGADITEERAYQFLQIVLHEYGYDDLSRILVKKTLSMKTHLENDYRRKIIKSIEESPYDKRTKDIIYQRYPVLIDTDKLPESASEVVFCRETKKMTTSGAIATYQIFKAELAQSAIDFLKKKPVDKNMLFIVVETPEGNFCRDSKGIHKESE